MIRGDAVFISDHRINQEFLGFRDFVIEGNKDDWLIALKLDYKHEVKIVNKNHPKHKQIVKLINVSLEHGIKSKWHNLVEHGMLMLFYLFERLADQDTFAPFKSEFEKRRNQISFDELSNIFLWLLISLSISIVVSVIKLITHKLKICIAKYM